MQGLIFPKFDIKLKKQEGKIYVFDIVRKKYIFLTPEEWVRQHCIHFLINELNYPKSVFSVERGHKINSRIKRSDLIIYDRDGKPFVLIEFKSTDIPINQAVMEQISTYNQTINAPFMVVTNGLEMLCAEISGNEILYSVEFPGYEH